LRCLHQLLRPTDALVAILPMAKEGVGILARLLASAHSNSLDASLGTLYFSESPAWVAGESRCLNVVVVAGQSSPLSSSFQGSPLFSAGVAGYVSASPAWETSASNNFQAWTEAFAGFFMEMLGLKDLGGAGGFDFKEVAPRSDAWARTVLAKIVGTKSTKGRVQALVHMPEWRMRFSEGGFCKKLQAAAEEFGDLLDRAEQAGRDDEGAEALLHKGRMDLFTTSADKHLAKLAEPTPDEEAAMRVLEKAGVAWWGDGPAPQVLGCNLDEWARPEGPVKPSPGSQSLPRESTSAVARAQLPDLVHLAQELMESKVALYHSSLAPGSAGVWTTQRVCAGDVVFSCSGRSASPWITSLAKVRMGPNGEELMGDCYLFGSHIETNYGMAPMSNRCECGYLCHSLVPHTLCLL
jgi:hypothetical protein